jgi:hypothetical protein
LASAAGWSSSVAEANAALLLSNAAAISLDQWTAAVPFGDPRRASVSGLIMLAAAGTNCL